MKNRISLIFAVTLAFLSLILFSTTESNLTTKQKILFDRIFMHQTTCYSIFYLNEDNSVEINTYSRYDTDSIKLICDVDLEDKMWADVKEEKSFFGKRYNIVFHLHSLKNINGAGWSNEEEKGFTTPLE